MQLTLKAARVNRGFTQADLAEKLGISIPTYARIEANPEVMSLRIARRLVDILGVKPEDLLGVDVRCGDLT